MLAPGTNAPEFSLSTTPDQKIQLSQFKGKRVILAFYPADWSPVCSDQMALYNEMLKLFHKQKAEIFGISVDTPFTLAKFMEENNYQFPLLSDFNKTVSTAYDCLYEEFAFGMKGVSKRAAFVIDEEQNIIYAEVLENAKELPDFAAINEALK